MFTSFNNEIRTVDETITDFINTKKGRRADETITYYLERLNEFNLYLKEQENITDLSDITKSIVDHYLKAVGNVDNSSDLFNKKRTGRQKTSELHKLIDYTKIFTVYMGDGVTEKSKKGPINHAHINGLKTPFICRGRVQLDPLKSITGRSNVKYD